MRLSILSLVILFSQNVFSQTNSNNEIIGSWIIKNVSERICTIPNNLDSVIGSKFNFYQSGELKYYSKNSETIKFFKWEKLDYDRIIILFEDREVFQAIVSFENNSLFLKAKLGILKLEQL